MPRSSERALTEIAHGMTQDMDPIAITQGRADTKRKQAAVCSSEHCATCWNGRMPGTA